MTSFTSHAQQIEQLVTAVISSHALHTKWLNTLSFLENCGARKIAACEHPTLVKEEMLKHASEEFRHAHYLKRQIQKISSHPLDTYALSSLLGGTATLHYLSALDLQVSRYLKNLGLPIVTIKETAYLLVTYAIELRADELYPIYDAILRKQGSRIAVKSILLEEKEHLNEMRQGIEKLPSGFTHAEYACFIEGSLCKKWLNAVETQIKLTDYRC